jgi:hypothetical protein
MESVKCSMPMQVSTQRAKRSAEEFLRVAREPLTHKAQANLIVPAMSETRWACSVKGQ